MGNNVSFLVFASFCFVSVTLISNKTSLPDFLISQTDLITLKSSFPLQFWVVSTLSCLLSQVSTFWCLSPLCCCWWAIFYFLSPWFALSFRSSSQHTIQTVIYSGSLFLPFFVTALNVSLYDNFFLVSLEAHGEQHNAILPPDNWSSGSCSDLYCFFEYMCNSVHSVPLQYK